MSERPIPLLGDISLELVQTIESAQEAVRGLTEFRFKTHAAGS